jgi:hypothetical protein
MCMSTYYTGRYVKHNARTSECSALERYEYGAGSRHGTRDVYGISGVPCFKELCRRPCDGHSRPTSVVLRRQLLFTDSSVAGYERIEG